MTTTSASARTASAAAPGPSTAPVAAAPVPPSPSRPHAGLASRLPRYTVPAIAVLAVLARVPFLGQDPSRDEAGFLLVGQQWQAGGTSLYGSYWVDRPPLLISLFRVASELGGLVPLRLMGCLATLLVVVGSAHVARRAGGPQAGRWAAAVAAALSVSPLLGGLAVNGELLSAPFVVGGVAAVVAAIQQRGEGRAAVAAGLAGAAMVAALLVKQNIADVAVFACVALLVAWRQGEMTTPRLLRSLMAYAVGALVCTGLVAGWTLLHGTSLSGVFDAMYPFRIQAAHVMAASDRTNADARLSVLAESWVLSGGAVIMALVLWAFFARRLRGAVAWGLAAVLLFDVGSVLLGGSYWTHYLIELVVPVAVISGLLVGRRQLVVRIVLGATVVAAVVALGVTLGAPQTTRGSLVGRAIGHAAAPQDTIVTTWGHADINRAAGLPSPYPYLWSLPARTLDPRLTALDRVLAGPQAPTWFVSWGHLTTSTSGGGQRTTAQLLHDRYRPVARYGPHTIYLRRGVERPVPHLSKEKP